MRARPYDELTIESWRKEPRLSNLKSLEIEDVDDGRPPALWKDVVLAVLIAALMWLLAAAAVG